MIVYKRGIEYQPGIISMLLQQSYIELYSQYPDYWALEKLEFENFDALTFNNPSTVGNCVFITEKNGQVVGMFSFDPRPGPLKGIVGHNCILPSFRGCGLGKLQILETLNLLRNRHIHNVEVSTGDHPFFHPAKKMYISCGFKETRRSIIAPGNHLAPFKMISYERTL